MAVHVRHVARDIVRVQPVRPALGLGLRAGLAVALPMAAAPWIGTIAAVWATLGGFGAAFVDKGGAYRTRATMVGALATIGAVAVLIGNTAADHAWVTTLVLAIGCTACALAAAFGIAAVSVGNSIAVNLIVALAVPRDPAHPWLPAVAFAGGAAWTMFLVSVLWPVRVYRPAREAAAVCLRGLADHARALGVRESRDLVTARHRTLRDALETARGVLAATRRGRRGETGRGDRLLMIVQIADQLFGALIALEDVLDSLGRDADAALPIARALGDLADTLDTLAARAVIEGKLPAITLATFDSGGAAAAVAARDSAPVVIAELGQMVSGMTRLYSDVALISAIIDTLATDSEIPLPVHATIADASELVQPSRLAQLRTVMSLDSAVLRHAMRVGVVAAVSVFVTHVLDLQRGYWATLSAVLLLQPYLPATLTRGAQRVLGTIAGGVLAAGIAALVHDPVGISIIVVVLATASGAVLQLNYALYALFLTPTFVLLSEIHAPNAHLVGVRIIDTLVGAALAVAGALLLWPSRESAQFGERAADALDAAARYLHAVVAATVGDAALPAPAATDARREAGLALNNADLSLERVIAEGVTGEALARRMTLLTTTRRMIAAVGALGVARAVDDIAPYRSAVAAAGASLEARAMEIADVLRGDGSGAREPAAAVVPDALVASRIARVEMQLDILGKAASAFAAERKDVT